MRVHAIKGDWAVFSRKSGSLRSACGVCTSLQGKVEPGAAADVAGALYEMGCYEVSMGDTTGMGTPASVAAMFQACSPLVPHV